MSAATLELSEASSTIGFARKTVLDLRDVTKRYNGHTVLDSVSLDLAEGETVCILGPSGSGKSTLLRCINWLEAPDEGSVHLLGRQVGVRENGKPMSDRELASIRTQIGMVFQHYALWPHLTVVENVMEAPLYVQRRPRAEVREQAEQLLEQVGLLDKRNVYPARLSGGQRQRVGIARALATRPKLMLFDEPTSALDPERVDDVLRIVRDLAGQGMTMIVVTHEMSFARRSASHIVFMDNGKVVEAGEPQAFFASPQTERARNFLFNDSTRLPPHHEWSDTTEPL
ncbi:lysine/arginine/ornithine ABC transporter/histidine ABC transporter, ATP binding subunit [Pararobbsia alpina]|uniref:amino acid ABC transporter ATP-binding protein n=1 Tax=Pararobbsia alpina TaxID=621374 RepID=UPI0039A530C1